MPFWNNLLFIGRKICLGYCSVMSLHIIEGYTIIIVEILPCFVCFWNIILGINARPKYLFFMFLLSFKEFYKFYFIKKAFTFKISGMEVFFNDFIPIKLELWIFTRVFNEVFSFLYCCFVPFQHFFTQNFLIKLW